MSVPRLTLRIVNVDSLPDGGPLSHSVQGQGFQAGRNPVTAWVLPDPAKRISGEHVRVHYQGGFYWLQDVSKNGTLLNGLPLEGLRPLAHGDQVGIGHYRIQVEIDPALPGTLGPAAESQGRDSPGADSPAEGHTHIAALPPGLTGRSSGPGFAASFATSFASDAHATNWSPPAVSQMAPQMAPQPAPQMVPPMVPHVAPHVAAPLGLQAAPRDAGAAGVLNAVARGAGLAPGIFSGQDAQALGEEIGQVLRIMAEQMIGLLAVRATTKKIIRSRNKTKVTPQGNNPLKTGPDAEAVLLQFFIQRSGYFLTASEALREGFADLRQHQSASYAAMQSALAQLVEDFSPEKIEAELRPGFLHSKAARAWTRYKAEWEERSRDHAKGMFDVFLAHFVAAYDRNTERPSTAARGAEGASSEAGQEKTGGEKTGGEKMGRDKDGGAASPP